MDDAGDRAEKAGCSPPACWVNSLTAGYKVMGLSEEEAILRIAEDYAGEGKRGEVKVHVDINRWKRELKEASVWVYQCRYSTGKRVARNGGKGS